MSDIFTLDENNNAAVRTVSVNAGVAETNRPDIFTTDENGNAAVRVVGGGGLDEDRVIIKSADIPTASADVLGQMYCFDGATNNTYAHGYIYECVEGDPVYTDTVEFVPATLSGTVVTATGNALADILVEYGSGDIASVESGTLTYDESGNLWVFVGKNSENTTVCTFQLYTEDYQDAGFTFTGTPQDGDVVAFTCTITESSSYKWERIDVQPAAKLGRYLSSWNCATGLAGTNPPQSPYEYTTGDYFIVGTVASSGGTNYRPNGSSYVTGQASTTVESSAVAVNDTYLYDGTSWTLLKTGSTVTSVNGEIGDVQIKTIDGNSIMGSGNLELSTYLPYPAGWTTNSTTKAFCDDIAADTTATVGKAYLGEVTLSDLPASMVNAEIVVEIMSGTTSANKVIVLTCTSGNTAPYRWQYTYWNNGTDVSGWKGFQPELVSGTNIKTINNVSLLGSGNITTADLGAVTQSTQTATLASTDWSSHSQTVTVTGVTATNTVIVAPAAASASDYAAAEILCTAQGTNSLTFTCVTDPTNNISVNIVILS